MTRIAFPAISDFGTDIIAVADDAEKLTEYNFGTSVYASENEFLDNEENKCAVMLATTMDINRIKSTITNYTKSFVYYDSDKIRCDYVYEESGKQKRSSGESRRTSAVVDARKCLSEYAYDQ